MKVLNACMLLLLNSGCISTRIELTNNSGNDVQVVSGHTMEKTKVPSNKTKFISHTVGDLMFENEHGDVFVFESVQAITSDSNGATSRKLVLKKDLNLYGERGEVISRKNDP